MNRRAPSTRGQRWRTAVAGTACAAASLVSVVISELGQRNDQAWQALLALCVAVVGLLLPVLLVRRRRSPYAVVVVSSLVAIVLPVGSWTALVALASLIGRRRDRRVWWAAGLAALATAVTVVRDTRGATSATSLIKSLFAPIDAPPGVEVDLGWWVSLLLVCLGVALSIGVGLALRLRREAGASAEQATAERRVADRLGDELARQRERERIGREVHDVLGHRLSLLNLHAGALEANAPDNGELATSAQLVRESASKAMDDLRSLLAMLHEPLDADPAAPELSLTDLPAVVDETAQTGAPVVSTVFLDRAETADPAVARAVYRIVQELLTNARRHAPGRPVRLQISGGPDRGIEIDARNPYLDHAASGEGSGQGLRGIAERVDLLGGRLVHGVDDGGRTFRVTATLPWQAPGD